MAEAALEYIRGQVTESPKQINLDSATLRSCPLCYAGFWRRI